jgi:hypothetical protein
MTAAVHITVLATIAAVIAPDERRFYIPILDTSIGLLANDVVSESATSALMTCAAAGSYLRRSRGA